MYIFTRTSYMYFLFGKIIGKYSIFLFKYRHNYVQIPVEGTKPTKYLK